MKKENKIRLSFSDRAFDVINILFLSTCLVLVLYPLIFVVSSSFSSASEVFASKVWLLPRKPTLLAYHKVFDNPYLWQSYYNTVYYTVASTVLSVALTVMFAFPLSRKDFAGRNIFMGILTFTMLFSGGLIPFYILVKNLNMIDTRWAMIIPSLMGAWNIILARTFFQSTIPDELYEAAELDGCSDIQFIIRIVLPLSGSLIAVLVLFYAIGKWNTYFEALIFLRSTKLQPLQIILRKVLVQNQIDFTLMTGDLELRKKNQGLTETIKYALIIFASLPALMIYPFVQKYFVKGIMVGSLKG